MNSAQIKAIRLKLKLSQEQMARELGCGTTTLRRWEQMKLETDVPMHIAHGLALDRLKRKADKETTR